MVKIPITDKYNDTGSGGGSNTRPNDTFGAVAEEVDGAGGAGVTGGDLTDPQDADAALEENVATRVGEEETWEQQAAGEIGSQTEHLRPSAADPDEGMSPPPAGHDAADAAAPKQSSGNTTAADGKSGGADSEADDLRNQLLRMAADFENYKRLAARRESEARDRAARNVLLDLLPVLDNFERAAAAANNAKDIESLRVGIGYIVQQLNDTLKTLGVEPIPAQGKKFDPLRHEASEEVPASGEEAGTVLEEAQRGYTYRGELLRPSRVKVAS